MRIKNNEKLKTKVVSKALLSLNEFLGDAFFSDSLANALVSNSSQKISKNIIAKTWQECERQNNYGKDPLREFQIKMLNLLSNAADDNDIDNIIPFYDHQADILLYLNINNLEIALFSPEKYELNFNSVDIKADIVKVSNSLPSQIGFVGLYHYNISPTYYTINDKKQLIMVNEAKRQAAKINRTDAKGLKELSGNYESNRLLPYIKDGEGFKYLEGGAMDLELAKDLASIQLCFLRGLEDENFQG